MGLRRQSKLASHKPCDHDSIHAHPALQHAKLLRLGACRLHQHPELACKRALSSETAGHGSAVSAHSPPAALPPPPRAASPPFLPQAANQGCRWWWSVAASLAPPLRTTWLPREHGRWWWRRAARHAAPRAKQVGFVGGGRRWGQGGLHSALAKGSGGPRCCMQL